MMKFAHIKPLFASMIAVFSILLACSAPAKADLINGYQLNQYCLSQNPNDDAICIVYITGAVDAITTMDLIAEKTLNQEKRFCVPDGTSPDDLKDAVMNWLARDGADLDFAATLLILGAVENRYSC